MLSNFLFTLALLSTAVPISPPAYSVNGMSLEEKVGQLLMVHVHAEQANNEAETLIKDTNVGSIIYYRWSNGLHSQEQVAALSSGLQSFAKQTRLQLPLIIAIDQEGGRVTRLKDGFTQAPSNQALAAIGSPSLAEHYAFVIGLELRSVGINMNLAPVVDVDSNPCNPVIGDRSYGDTPETVITYGERALEGYRRAHILTSIKHFPGHGDVEADSHRDLPVVYKTKEELYATELLPFVALAQHADTVMTAHISIPSLDPNHCATASKAILNILRNDIGFDGPIISDSLVMQGILKEHHTPEEAAVAALEAGCDILMLGGKQLVGGETRLELSAADIKRIHRHLVDAVHSGRISEERIDASVRRILALKEKIAK